MAIIFLQKGKEEETFIPGNMKCFEGQAGHYTRLLSPFMCSPRRAGKGQSTTEPGHATQYQSGMRPQGSRASEQRGC